MTIYLILFPGLLGVFFANSALMLGGVYANACGAARGC
jgi:ascorbate-specific PTS system EIIC-type component UlaA